MKKTLIALAAVAVSSAAFAQSTVAITGLVEIAPFNTQEVTTRNAADAPTNPNQVITTDDDRTSRVNTWGTSVVTMRITEDLGGGLRAEGVLISEPAADFGLREHTLGLSGAFGAVRFGRFVPASANGFHALSGSGSAVMLGSIYGVTTGHINFAGATRATFERQSNVLQYTSPNFSGFTFNASLASNVNDSSDPARIGENKTRQTGLGLNYTAGPIVVAMGLNNRSGETEAVTPATTRSTLNWVAGSYDFGVARVFVAHAQREDKATTTASPLIRLTNGDVNVTSFGVSVPMDAFTFRASMYRGSDDRAAGVTNDTDLSGYQLAAIYALSKRTSVIAAHGVNKTERAGGSTANEREVRSTTLTVQHTF